MNRRLYLSIFFVLVQFAGCGFQIYLGHHNSVVRRELMNAARRLEDRSRQVEAETENLNRLLRLPPPKPAPDPKSKL